MPLKVPRIDDKTFDELVEEARKRIPQHAPEWTDYNLHELGITFIELLAWLIEMQISILDELTERHRLKFLKLLDVEPRISFHVLFLYLAIHIVVFHIILVYSVLDMIVFHFVPE